MEENKNKTEKNKEVKTKEVKIKETKNTNKKKVENKVKTQNENKFSITKKNKMYVFIAAIVLIVLLVIIGISYIVKENQVKKYEAYEEKMDSYGFSVLYNNKSCATREKVTNSEAIKMAIGVILNTYNIDGISKEPKDKYENARWVEYAKSKNILNTDKINSGNENNGATYLDAISFLGSAKQKILKLDSKTTDKKLADMKKYNQDEQKIINDMLADDILKKVGGKLNANKKVFKGQVNEIVVNYIEKYNLIADEKTKLEFDQTKWPSNASEYPYIVKGVAKEVYEIPFKVDTKEKFKNPKDSYKTIKGNYEQIIEKVEKYYNTMLNVDYNTINENEFKNKLENLTVFNPEEDKIKEYVKYVKDNQIILAGNVKVQEPIIYFDGFRYKVRIKMNFEIKNSKTKENVLYIDFVKGKNSVYKKDKFEKYFDVNMSKTVELGTYYVREIDIKELLEDKECIDYKIVEEEMKENVQN